jgi:GDP-L-fucose synthase
MLNILLTGGSGFIGRNIRESFLAKEYNIFAPSHKELDIIKDLHAYVAMNHIDIIIHAAVPSTYREEDNEDLFNEMTAMSAVVASCRYKVKKIIFLGSGAAVNPTTSYGKAKRVEECFAVDGTNIYVLRLYGVYGPYEDYSTRFISNMICKALCHKDMTIKKDRRFSYLFIDDFITILFYCLHKDWGMHCLDIVPDENNFLSEIACIVRNECKAELPIIMKDCSLGKEYTGNSSAFRDMCPAFTFTPIASGIASMVDYYEGILSTIDRSKLMEDK